MLRPFAAKAGQGRLAIATMEGVTVNGPHRVLIVDPSEETREVLQTVLERHGVATLSAGRLKSGMELAQRSQPDLIVLDIESVDACSQQFLTPLTQPANVEPPRLLLLGAFRRQGDAFPSGEFISKPYHYGALIRKIEELIGESGTCQHCLSSVEPIKEPVSN